MATNKKSVLLYCDIIHTVKELSNEEAGKLFKHYLEYINDLNPTAPDKLTQIVFEPIKQTLKRDLKKWESKSERNKEIAIAGWEKRKNANASNGIKNDAKNADKDIVKVIDIVKDKDNIILKENFRLNNEVIKIPVSEYFKQNFQAFREQWVMKNGTAIEKTVYEKMDTDYLGYTFTDLNHIQNTFKAVWKKVIDQTVKNTITKPGKALN